MQDQIEEMALIIRMKAQGLEEMTIGQNEFSMEEIDEIIEDAEILFRVSRNYRYELEKYSTPNNE